MLLSRLTLFLALTTTATHAAIITVGPGEPVSQIAKAAHIAQDGDTVLIKADTYSGDVAVWTQKRLEIRGIEGRPVLSADGKSAEGKAIWVFRNGDYTVDNIEFRGTRVPDGNGAGIRFEQGRLTVTNSAFIDNQTGILTANFADAQLRIVDCLFANAPKQDHSLPHLLYVGRIARFEVRGSRFHQGYRGHLIKTRAQHNEIRYNLIYDGPVGEASYEIDIPNGGVAFIIGNVIGQSAHTQNPVLIAYGAEGDAWPDSALYLSHNTLLSDRMLGAWFLRIWKNRLPSRVDVKAINNLTVGFGAFTLAAGGEFSGNIPAVSSLLGGTDILDFTLPEDSLLRHFGTPPGEARNESLAPEAEFKLPVGSRKLAPPATWAPGALQTPR